MSIVNILKAVLTAAICMGIATAKAATLNHGDWLTIGEGSWFMLDLNKDGMISPDEMVMTDPGSDDGIHIGSTQLPGSIDSWSFFDAPGSHYTTVAPTGGVATGIDFSGWSVFYNGHFTDRQSDDILDQGTWVPTNCDALGCMGVDFTSGVAAFQWSGVYGDNYHLWHSWSFLDQRPGAFVSTDYFLYLTGEVRLVPLPPAMLLFASGLLLLSFHTRRFTAQGPRHSNLQKYGTD